MADWLGSYRSIQVAFVLACFHLHWLIVPSVVVYAAMAESPFCNWYKGNKINTSPCTADICM